MKLMKVLSLSLVLLLLCTAGFVLPALPDLASGNYGNGANLSLQISNVTSSNALLILHHPVYTQTGDIYEVWSKTNLNIPDWNIETNVWAVVNQNWTPFTVPMLGRPNLFIWARDWMGMDENSNNIPDWWEYEHLGGLLPVITMQPSSRTVVQGNDVTFNVGVSSNSTIPLSYQWYFNGTNINGAIKVSLTLTNVQTTNAGNYSVVVTNVAGSVASSNAVLIVNVPMPPVITQQPTNQIAVAGSNVTFIITAAGTTPLCYQWRCNGTNLIGATNPDLVLNAVQTNNNGSYNVLVTNMAGSVTSSIAVLTVYVPPSITLQPTNQTAVSGSNVTFDVTAIGTLLNYQWYSNTVTIAGANGLNLIFTNVSTDYSGNYFVVITNAVGVVTSSIATLTVIDPLLDTDGDGLTDAYEIFFSHTDPTKWDSNGNGISDGDELKPGGLPWHLEQARSGGAAVIYANSTNAPEGGACGQCTVYLPAPAPLGGTTVQYLLGGTAMLNTDFTMSPSSSALTIPSGSSSGTISVCAINDTAYSGLNRYVIVTLTNSTSCPVDGHPAQVNIIDNDPPDIRVYALPPWVRRPSPTFGTNFAGFYFVRDRGSSNALTVGLSTSGSTAVAGTDYSALPSPIVFPASVRTNWLPLTIMPSTNTSDKMLVLTITSAPGCQIDQTNGTATMTISSTGLPALSTVQVVTTVADATGSTPGQFTFSRSSPVTDALRVYYHTAGDTVIGTTNGQDITSYSALPGYVDIPAGATSATVSVVPNTPSGIAQTVTVILAAGEYSIGTSNVATVYIDGVGSFYITATVVRDGIYGANVSQPAEIQITRYGSVIAPRSITWSITNQYIGNRIASFSISGDGNGTYINWAAHQTIANVKISTQWTSWPDSWQLPTMFLSTNWYLTVPYNPPSAMFGIYSSGSPATIVSEGTTVPNAITIIRLHPTANPITMYLTVAGSAVNGTDFSMGTMIGFTANQSSITVPVQAFANPLTTGWKTAVVTMNSGGFSSQVGLSGHDLAYVRIQDAQVSNPVFDTDIDGDGIPDGYELNHLADGYDPIRSNNPYVDNDRDGFGLMEELQLGTDPNVPDAPPVHPSPDDSDYVPLKLHLGAAGKLINAANSCGACHEVTLRAGSHISTSPRSNWTNNPALADYTIRFLRGTNYPIQVMGDPYTYVLPSGQTNTVSPHYTAAYIAQFFSGTNGGLYPFITDSNQLLGASQPMVLDALSKSAMLYVPDMMIAADVDRDGVVNFTNRTDRTATNSPYLFWINDDADSGSDDSAQDLNPTNNPINSANSTIDGLRDLEDFARLQFKITALPQKFLTDGHYQVRIYMTNLVGSPSIRLFPAIESNGGLGYLTNTTMANAQVISSALGVLASGTPVTVPSANWVTITSNSFLLPMIFEGVTTGRCVITLGFSSNSGPAVALSRPFYLDLKRVTDLYEHWTVGDDTTTEWNQIPPVATRTPDSEVFGAPQKQEDSDCILFVHGWRMQPWERRAFASTAYKRLYWQNYKGRFVFFSWPTDWLNLGTDWYSPSTWISYFNGVVLDAQNFDRSEQRAWNSGAALRGLAANLDKIYPGRVRVMAHSMGNVVVGESLRLATDAGLSGLFHTYVAMQGAIAAHCYDSNATVRALNSILGVNNDSGTFNLYRYFWEQQTLPPSFDLWKPYLYDVNGAGRSVNFLNPLDVALSSWRYDQDTKPDRGWYYDQYGFRRNSPSARLDRHFDRYEIFARVAEARCYALGAELSMGGTFQYNQVNLNTAYGWQGNSYEHSAEFNSTIQRRTPFWGQVLDQMQILH